MSYQIEATSTTPALVIYLLDISYSMAKPLDGSDGKRRIDIVSDALESALRQMVYRSTKGKRVSPRYRVAMFAYNKDVWDILGSVKTVSEVAQYGVPELTPASVTNTAAGFAQVKRLLQSELPVMQNCPAPLVCHMTDGEYTGNDPTSIVKEIMSMKVPDGNVLVENIFISNDILSEPIKDISWWPGINATTKLNNKYARKLRELSSPIPPNIHEVMVEDGFHLDEDAIMLFPGINREMVAMGFQVSGATGAKRGR